jgi:hypothetical protein
MGCDVGNGERDLQRVPKDDRAGRFAYLQYKYPLYDKTRGLP